MRVARQDGKTATASTFEPGLTRKKQRQGRALHSDRLTGTKPEIAFAALDQDVQLALPSRRAKINDSNKSPRPDPRQPVGVPHLERDPFSTAEVRLTPRIIVTLVMVNASVFRFTKKIRIGDQISAEANVHVRRHVVPLIQVRLA